MSAIAWNDYQQDIFKWATEGSGNATVSAVAGSGKTTVIEEMIRRICAEMYGTDVLYCVFNKHNRESAEKKFGHMATVKTIHQLGFAMIAKHLAARRLDMKEYKYYDIVDDLLAKRGIVDKRILRDLKGEYTNLIDKVRVTLTDVNDKHALFEMCDKYGIEYEEWMLDELPIAIQIGVDQLMSQRKIDYTDMIFMPLHLGMDCAKFAWVLVDEAQDLSNCQRELVLLHQAKKSRLGAVGDPYQSIYGFAGANPQSYGLIQTRTNATELPLSVCYRCPKSHIELAQELVPHIEWAPGAKEGIVRAEPDSILGKEVRAGDLILCRNTAPLIKGCINLIKHGIRSNVRGRNIGAGLVKIVKKIDEKEHFNPSTFASDFLKALEHYSDREMERLIARDASESVIETFTDKILCIHIVFESFDPSTPADLIGRFDDLFNDSPSTIYFSSIHRAKGLENPRVIILKSDRMSLRWKGQTEEERQQEDNAKYVGLTRAKDEMILTWEADAV